MDLIPPSKIKEYSTTMGVDNSAAVLQFGKVTALSDDEIEIRSGNVVAKIKISEGDVKPEIGDLVEVQLGNGSVPDKIVSLYRGKERDVLPSDGGCSSTSKLVTEVANEERGTIGRRFEMRDYAPVTYAPVTAPVTMRDYAPVTAPVVVNIGPDLPLPLDLPIAQPCSPVSLENELRKSEINLNDFLDYFSDIDIIGLLSD